MADAARSVVDRLELADWRRRLTDIYAEVRRLALDDPAHAHAFWRREREDLYRRHSQSPVPPSERATFVARYYSYDATQRFDVPVVRIDHGAAGGIAPHPEPVPLDMLPMSSGDPLAFEQIGWVDIPFAVGSRRLALFWMEGYAGGLFLPFRDATNGRATYGAGRYLLDGVKGADLGGDLTRGTLILDFNFAFQPSCAFDPRWSCPLAPPENWLDVPLEAGERLT